ncbi:hypothetical protein AAFN85_14390 [Mucilaginibacter sp. CAU 1740]|uniref:hypothetical protein n=1 Tax=Mucilaginibacter sp. CAU 1740 TaxID=3140365 RepID=UPI00325A9BF1
MPEFITFKKFNDAALAWALTDLLEENDIEYRTEEGAFSFDPTFGASKELATEYVVKISPDDFTRATELLKASEANDIAHIDKDYYLYSFTDVELKEILEKADEWSTFDYELARKLLAERGVDVSDEAIANINKQREIELKKPEASQTTWIVIGYICALAGGVFGMFIGWHLSSYKKTLPSGERVYEYLESDRKQGRIILYISIATTTLAIIYKIFNATT